MPDYNAQTEGLTGLDQMLLASSAATARMNGRDGFLEAIQAADSMVQAKVKKVTDEHTAGFLQAVMGQGMDPAVAYQKYPRASEKLIVGFLDRIMSQRETLDAEGRAQTRAIEAEGRAQTRAIEAEGRADTRARGTAVFNQDLALKGALDKQQVEQDLADKEASQQQTVAGVLGRDASAASVPEGTGIAVAPGQVIAGGGVPQWQAPAGTSVIDHSKQGYLENLGITEDTRAADRGIRAELGGGFMRSADEIETKNLARKKIEAEIAAKIAASNKTDTGPKGEYNRFMAHATGALETGGLGLSEDEAQARYNAMVVQRGGQGAFARTEGGLLGGATPGALDARQAGAAAAAAGTVAGSGGKVTPIPDMIDPATGLPIFANNQGQMSTGTPPAGVMPEKRASEADVTFEQATGLIRDNISQIKKLYSPDFTGKWDSKIVANLRQRTTGNSEQEAAFRIAVASMQDTELRKRSGAAITDSEMARLQQFVPDPNMSDTEFAAAMNNYERELDAIIAARQAAKKPWKAKSAAPAAATGGLPAGAFQGADGGWYVKNPDGKTAKRVK